MRRREFSGMVRAEIVLRATDTRGVVCCEGCGLALGKKPYEIDHITAEGLIVDKSRKLTAKDGQLLGKKCCHRAPGGKTAQDQARIAKAKRQEANHLGTTAPTTRPLKGRGFPHRPRPQKAFAVPAPKKLFWPVGTNFEE